MLDREDLRKQPLLERRALLSRLIKQTGHPALRYSEEFSDAKALLAAADAMKLEGIVLKRKTQIYRSGRNPGWLKIKTDHWIKHGRK